MYKDIYNIYETEPTTTISWDMIQRYVSQCSSKEETRIIEMRMNDDALFAEAMEGFMSDDSISNKDKIEKAIQNIENNIYKGYIARQSNESNTKTPIRWLAIAACILVVLGLGFLINDTIQKNKNQEAKVLTINSTDTSSLNQLSNNSNVTNTIPNDDLKKDDEIHSDTTTKKAQASNTHSTKTVAINMDNSQENLLPTLSETTAVYDKDKIAMVEKVEEEAAVSRDVNDVISEETKPTSPAKNVGVNSNAPHINIENRDNKKDDVFTKNDSYVAESTSGHTVGDGIDIYNNKQYLDAISVFSEILSYDKNNMQAITFRARAYARQGECNKAANDMDRIPIDNINYPETEWIIAQCYLSNNQIKKAKALLQVIVNRNNIYSAPAKDALEAIK